MRYGITSDKKGDESRVRCKKREGTVGKGKREMRGRERDRKRKRESDRAKENAEARSSRTLVGAK